MADVAQTNPSGAEAAQAATEDQQVSSSVFQNKSISRPDNCKVIVLFPYFKRINHDLYLSKQGLFLFSIKNVVSRVSNLPLVSSTCEAVSNAYSSTKENVPLLKGVMDVAESGARTLGAAASTGSKPLLDMLEPQSEFLSLSTMLYRICSITRKKIYILSTWIN